MNQIFNLKIHDSELMCKTHQQKKIEFICTKSGCNQRLLCTNCMINFHSHHFRWIQLIAEFFKPQTQKELSELTQNTRKDIQDLLSKEEYYTEKYKNKLNGEKIMIKDKSRLLRDQLNHELDSYNATIKDKSESIKRDFKQNFMDLCKILIETKEYPTIEKSFENIENFKRFINEVIIQENIHHENIIQRKYDEVLTKLNSLSMMQFNQNVKNDILKVLTNNDTKLIKFDNEVDKYQFYQKFYAVGLSKFNYANIECKKIHKTTHKKSIYKIVFFEDQTQFATCSDDSSIIIWDINKEDPIKELYGHTDRIWNLYRLQNGNLASSSSDKTIRIWDPYKGKCEKILKGHSDFIASLLPLPKLLLMSGSHDKTIRVWDLKIKKEDESCVQVIKHASQGRIMILLIVNADDIAAGSEKNIIIFQAHDGLLKKTLVGHTSLVRDLYLIEDTQTLVSSSDDKSIKLWNLADSTCIKTLTGHSYSTNKILLFNPGILVSSSDDHTLKFWKLDTGECVRTLTGHEGWIIFITILHDGSLASCGADKVIRFWSE